MANKLLAICLQITMSNYETKFISYVTFEVWDCVPVLVKGVCVVWGHELIIMWSFVLLEAGDTMVCGQGTLQKEGTSRY
jgi:hypothetical protein